MAPTTVANVIPPRNAPKTTPAEYLRGRGCPSSSPSLRAFVGATQALASMQRGDARRTFGNSQSATGEERRAPGHRARARARATRRPPSWMPVCRLPTMIWRDFADLLCCPFRADTPSRIVAMGQGASAEAAGRGGGAASGDAAESEASSYDGVLRTRCMALACRARLTESELQRNRSPSGKPTGASRGPNARAQSLWFGSGQKTPIESMKLMRGCKKRHRKRGEPCSRSSFAARQRRPARAKVRIGDPISWDARAQSWT